MLASQKIENDGSPATEVFTTWTSCLLAVYAHTGVNPSTYTVGLNSKWGEEPGQVRTVAIRLWLDIMGDDSQAAEGWIEMVFRLSERAHRRLMSDARSLDPQIYSPRLFGHLRALVETLKPRIDQQRVRAAIAAGWTGCETRGVDAWRKAHHLLHLVREWIPAEVQPATYQR